jgi:hypothetical protein
MDMSINQKDFDEWRENPVTEAVFEILEDRIKTLKEQWGSMSLADGKLWEDDTARFLRHEVLAKINAYQEVLEIDYEEKDDEQHGDNPH